MKKMNKEPNLSGLMAVVMILMFLSAVLLFFFLMLCFM